MSLLFSSGSDAVLVEYAVVNGGIMIFSMITGLELHHKLMQIVPSLPQNLDRIILNTKYLRMQLVLGLIGIVPFFVWLCYFKYSNIAVIIGVFYTSFITIELGRLFRSNGKVLTASRFEFRKTLYEGLLLIVLLSIQVDLLNIFIAALLSSIISLYLVRKELWILVDLKSLLSLTRLKTGVPLVVDGRNMLLLLGTISLRYIQIIDRQLLESYEGAEIASYWVFTLGLSMFIYRALDSMILQFALPKLISLRGDTQRYILTAKMIMKRTLLWTSFFAILVFAAASVYLQILRGDNYHDHSRFLPITVVTVVGLVIFSLLSMLYFSVGSLVIYSLLNMLVFLVIILSLQVFSISVLTVSLVITLSYLFVGILSFILWKREMR